MSRFFSKRLNNLEAYVPGEQPRDKKYIKLNTNESPFPPAPGTAEKINKQAVDSLRLYSDNTASAITQKIADMYNVNFENVLLCNGSDEALSFCFLSFCDSESKVAFADITYGLYSVLANLYGIEYDLIPLKEDFTINISDYFNIGKTVLIANPNAPTGIALSRNQIEEIVRHNPDNLVIIDEAYVDFGAESAVPLTEKYDNILVIQTFSKSRSLAGARLGFAVGNKALIADLNTIKYSINPYNVNTLSQIAGAEAVNDKLYFKAMTENIIKTRVRIKSELEDCGFSVLDSKANFLFAKHPKYDGEYLYNELKKSGILVRHFNKERIKDYLRITIGSDDEMNIFADKIKKIADKHSED